MSYPYIFWVALLMDLFVLCGGECLVKQYAICLAVVVSLLLNVIEVLSVGGGALLDRQCASRCYLHSFCLCISEVILSFTRLRAGSQVFSLIMLFLCVIFHFHTMWSGKSLQLLCIFPFVYCVCLPLE